MGYPLINQLESAPQGQALNLSFGDNERNSQSNASIYSETGVIMNVEEEKTFDPAPF